MTSNMWPTPAYIPDLSGAGYPDWFSDRKIAARHLDFIKEKNQTSNESTRCSSSETERYEAVVEATCSEEVRKVVSITRAEVNLYKLSSPPNHFLIELVSLPGNPSSRDDVDTRPMNANLPLAQRVIVSQNAASHPHNRLGRSPSRSRTAAAHSMADSTTNEVNTNDTSLLGGDDSGSDTTFVSRRPIHQPKTCRKSTTGTRTYTCDDCGKDFARRTLRNNHKRTHTDERPFICTAQGCIEAFKQKNEQIRHEKSRHRSKRFICGGTGSSGTSWGCGKKFARSDGLLEHQTKTEKGRHCRMRRDEGQ